MPLIVQDLDRPDVKGQAPKMQGVKDTVTENLSHIIQVLPFLHIITDDNIMSSVTVKGSLDPRETWSNGIWQNSRHFMFSVTPMNGRRYHDPTDPKVTVKLTQRGQGMTSMRKYTGPVDRVVAKIREWILSQV